jgi:hypothetical protein
LNLDTYLLLEPFYKELGAPTSYSNCIVWRRSDIDTAFFFYKDGSVMCVSNRDLYGEESRLHTDGPAATYYHSNGQVDKILYKHKGRLHRSAANGPAVIKFKVDEPFVTEYIQYWEYGKQIKDER